MTMDSVRAIFSIDICTLDLALISFKNDISLRKLNKNFYSRSENLVEVEENFYLS